MFNKVLVICHWVESEHFLFCVNLIPISLLTKIVFKRMQPTSTKHKSFHVHLCSIYEELSKLLFVKNHASLKVLHYLKAICLNFSLLSASRGKRTNLNHWKSKTKETFAKTPIFDIKAFKGHNYKRL